MAFWNGTVTFTRFQVSGESPLPFSEEILERARIHRIGFRDAPEAADRVAMGWAGGEHVLDLSLELAKNVVDDALHLALRIDTDKIPGALLRAYTQIEIDARAHLSPSGVATKAQRAEAKEAATQRALAEAADGRFRRLAHFPILWDGRTNTVFAGSTSPAVLDRVTLLFRETFDRVLEPITAGTLARGRAVGDVGGPNRSLVSVEGGSLLSSGGPAQEGGSVAWNDAGPASLDFLGNEFLVWIWHSLQYNGEKVLLGDGTEVTVTLAKTLTLDCPRGETGRDQLTDLQPTRLPEALRALQAGKLPRKSGMVLVRHGLQYELTVQAETLAVSSARLPKLDTQGRAPHDTRIARLESLRDLEQTLDLLYFAFLNRRTSAGWSDELGRIRRWLRAA
jgi:hypothetical protein